MNNLTAVGRWRVIWMICFAAVALGTAVAAQAPDLPKAGLVLDLSSFLSVAGVTLGAGALVAWGRQGETVKNNANRIGDLEEDRVTRQEFITMQHDIREIRKTIDRRMIAREEV